MKIKLAALFVFAAAAAVNIFIIADWVCIAKSYYKFNNHYIEDTDRLENNLPFDENKKPLITMGCSFTYGSGVEPDENLSYFLQKYTGRKVYNRGIPGEGPPNLLLQLQKHQFFNDGRNLNPQYIIYTFISDHTRRMYVHKFNYRENYIFDYYKYKDKKFIMRDFNPKLMDYINVSYLMQRIDFEIFKRIPDDKKFDLLKAYLLEIQKEIKKRYKDTKFAVIVYNPELDAVYTHGIQPFRTERWKELEELNIKVIRFDGSGYDFLNTDEYISRDMVHPSKKAWEVLAPVIIKELNL